MKVTRIESNKFKTNEIGVFLAVPLKRETITKNVLLPAVLKRGSMNYKNQIYIEKKLENMYGASIGAGTNKTGNYLVIRFFMATICNDFVNEKVDLANESISMLFDIIFNPFVENESFNEEYVNQERENLAKAINSKKDNKDSYALNRCIEELFKDEPYGLYKNGYIEDLDKINAKNLYEYYLEMIKECKVHVIIDGKDANEIKIPKINYNIEELTNVEEIDKIKNNNDNSTSNTLASEIVSDFEKHIKEANVDLANANEEKAKLVTEELDVKQGKLLLGLKVKNKNKFATTMYNVILGGGANSKLFQNVREKASLAYYASSSYIRRKNAIIIRTGIELQNYDKALKIIEEQIDNMRKGKITDKEIEDGRELVVSSLRTIPESQDDTITYTYDQELFEENLSLDEYIKKLEAVTKGDIIDVAKDIEVKIIYYLKDISK